ncbi:MAG: heavy-metal-associated domain-containing protein [Saprospiraceae bacterium]|jgi:copper chaperone|nr:heavy-metal-associated domain-containing protein [Saprospiraceae bacterium]
MKIELQAENIKCGGCARSIRQSLEKLTGVSSVDVVIEEGQVLLEGDDTMDREEISQKLLQMGYPEPGKGNVLTTVNSYVSCMIGKVS